MLVLWDVDEVLVDLEVDVELVEVLWEVLEVLVEMELEVELVLMLVLVD